MSNAPAAVSARIARLFVYPVKSCRGTPLSRGTLTKSGMLHDREWMVVTPAGRFLTQRELPKLALVSPALREGALVLDAPGMPTLAVSLDDRSGERRPVVVWRDACQGIDAGDAVADWFSTFLGRPVRLVRFDESQRRGTDPQWSGGVAGETRFSDGFPLLVTSQGSLDEVNGALQERGADPVPMTRFRPNLVLAGLPPRAEDRHRRIELPGGVRLDLVKPCDRCAITTVDQDSGERHPSQPVATLRAIRRNPRTGGACFGQNAVPVLPAGEAVLCVGDPCRLGLPVQP